MSEEVLREAAAGEGKLDFSEIANCRMRIFTEGLILGTKSFIEKFWCERRLLLGKNRRRICSPVPGDGWGDLHSFRPPE